jgi:hypothetical protein
MKFKNILAEQLMLMENVAQAEKALKELNIPLDDPEYLRIKNMLVADNSVGFLGFMFNLVKIWAKNALKVNDDATTYKNANPDSWIGKNMPNYTVNNDVIFKYVDKLYALIKKHRQDLQFLPKNINDYDKIDDLIYAFNFISTNKTKKRFANLIINKELKSEYIANHPKSEEESQLVRRYLEVIHDTPYGKMFVKKINRYNTLNDLLGYLKIVSTFYDLDISYDSILSKASNRRDLQIVYNQKERIILLIGSYEAMREVGSPSWCIYDSRSQYDNYTKNGNANQYIFYDFSDQVTDVSYSMIGFTMQGYEITASHLMNDDHISDVMSYLNKIGVYPKLRIINTELEKIRKDKEVINNNINIINQIEEKESPDYQKKQDYNNALYKILNAIVVDLERYEYADDFLESLSYANINSNLIKENSLTIKYRDLFTRFLNDTGKMNYDVIITKIGNIVKFLQDYVYIRFGTDYDEDSSWTVIEKVQKLNLVSKGFFNYVNKRPDILAALKKVFINLKGIQPQTYSTFIDAFYNWDVSEDEVNKLIRLRKTKQGEDYSDVEFHRIKDTGDLSSIILNKLQRARRGEDVGLTFQQVKYGVDKGLKNILFNYYKKVLPYFLEQQVDYDYARIYQTLGLGKELKDVVLKKYNMMGGDQNPNSINSIERSVLDVN